MLNALMFLGIYVGGIIAALRYGSFIAFIVYQLVYFMSPQLRWWGYYLPSIPYSMLIVIFMVSLVFLKEKQSNNQLFSVPQFKWLYSLLALFAITSFYAVWPEAHNASLIDYLKLCIIISFAFKLIDTVSKLKWIMATYSLGASYIGFLAYQVGRGATGRVEGLGTVDAPESNGIAAALAPSIVISAYLFLSTKNKYVKVISLLMAAITLNGLILINSRGAFLGVLVSSIYFLLFLYFSKVKLKHQKIKVTSLLIIGLLGVSTLVDNSFLDRMSSIQSSKVTEEKETGATRVIFWESAFKMSLDFPLGAGTRSFEAYSPFYIPETTNTGKHRNRAVHSSWFEVLTELGYVGLFLFLMLLWSCFSSCKKVRISAIKSNNWEDYYRTVAIQSALVCAIVTMTFLNRYRAEFLYWLILMAACNLNIFNILQREKGQREDICYKPKKKS